VAFFYVFGASGVSHIVPQVTLSEYLYPEYVPDSSPFQMFTVTPSFLLSSLEYYVAPVLPSDGLQRRALTPTF